MKKIMDTNDFCKCESELNVYSKMDTFGYWYVCNNCKKPIEDSYVYFSEELDDKDFE